MNNPRKIPKSIINATEPKILEDSNLNRIRDSFKQEHLFSVIIVNEKFEIIDGQTRFTIAEELGLPIYYIVCHGYSLKEVITLNANAKNWKNSDYLNSFCELGFPEYIKMRNFMRKYKSFSIGCALSLCALVQSDGYKRDKNNNKTNVFRNGGFKCVDIDMTEEIATQLLRIRMITEIYKRKSFITAYMKIYRHPNFEANVFFKKMKMYTKMIQPCVNSEQYIEMFEEIYNYRNRSKVGLRY